MSTYPTSPAFSFPVTRRLEFETRIFTGRDGTEQRTMIHPGRESWELPYPRLTATQRDLLFAAFDAEKGSQGQAIDFTFDGTTYQTCYFVDDSLSFTETVPGFYSGTVKLAQVVRAADTGALSADFPVLSTGAKLQRPYTTAHTFDTVEVRTEGGRYTRANRTGTLRTWTAGGSVLTPAEAGAIWDHFRRCRGRYHTFHFTPEGATEYIKCRFASDVLEWRYVSAGHSAIEVTITQVP